MTPYLLLLSIPSLLALQGQKRSTAIGITFVSAIFVLFIGFRYQVGPDWLPYKYVHMFIGTKELHEVLSQRDPLSFLVIWISQTIGQNMTISNISAAMILMFGASTLAMRTPNPWLAMVAATPYLIIVFGMSGIRQAMAVGVILFVVSRWNNWSVTGRTAGVLVASLFHTSALAFGLFVLAGSKTKLFVKIPAALVLLTVVYFLSQNSEAYLDAFRVYDDRYLEDPDAILSAGSLFHILLIIIPSALAFIYQDKIKHLVLNNKLLTYGIFYSVFLLALNFLSSTVASRLSLYFYFVPMMVYPALSFTFGAANRNTVTLVFLVFHFLVLITWMMYANVAFAYLPYQNLLFK